MLLLFSAYTFLVHRFWFVTDDSYISFRYARNFAQGFGLRYNVAPELPVEGYSNLIWVLLCSIVEFFHLDPGFWMLVISFICGCVVLGIVQHILSKRMQLDPWVVFLALAILALFPPFAVWTTGGLETMLFTLLLLLTFYYLHYGETRSDLSKAGFSALLLTLCRPEGVIWALLLISLRLLRQKIERRSIKSSFLPFVILLIGLLLHLVWRYSYYQAWVPNTVYAKAGISAESLERGFDYVAEFFLTFPSKLLLCLIALNVLRKNFNFLTITCALVSFGTIAWAVMVGGDFMTMGRFFIQALPFECILVAIALQNLRNRYTQPALIYFSVLILAINLMPAWNIHLVPRSVLKLVHFRHNTKSYRTEYEQWRSMNSNFELWKHTGTELAKISKPGDSIVLGAIGAVGYFSNLYIYDRFGLINREVSRMPVGNTMHSPGHDSRVPPNYFLRYKPTYLQADYYKGKRVHKAAENLLSFWRHNKLNKGYVPEIHFVSKRSKGGVHDALIVVRRLKESDNVEELHKLYLAQIAKMSSTKRG